MKKIEAVIKPFKLDEVRDALFEIGIGGMTVSEVAGCGRQDDRLVLHQGNEYNRDLLPKVKLEIVLADDQVKLVVDSIVSAAKTGKSGDGKVFVTDIQAAVRIRTEEEGAEAL